jgi:hypothetical protein
MKAMAARRFLVAIIVGAAVLAWWTLFGFPMVSAACNEIDRLTPFRGPFSSVCFHSFILRGSRPSGYVALWFGHARV